MVLHRSLRVLLGGLALAVAAGPATASLVGSSLTASLDSPNGFNSGGLIDPTPISLTDTVTVGAGAEIVNGNGTNIGAFLLPEEFVDIGATSISLRIQEGLNASQGGGTGYLAGARYVFSGFDFGLGTSLVGATLTDGGGFSNFADSWLSFDAGTLSVSLALDTMQFLQVATPLGNLTINLLTREGPDPGTVAEPGTLALAGLAFAALAAAHRRRRVAG